MRQSLHYGVIVLVLSLMAAVAVFAEPPAEEIEPAPHDDGFAARLAEVDHRIEVKRQLAADLADGRRSLTDVVARFASLDAGRPEVESAAEVFPGKTAGERYCRLVIENVAQSLRDNQRRSEVVARLNRELATVIFAGVQLPTVKSSP